MNKPSPAADSVALAATSKSDETEVASITVTTEVTTPITTEIAAPETVGEPLPAKEKVAKKREIDGIEEDVKRRVEEAFVYAMESPFPNPEEALEDLFA